MQKREKQDLKIFAFFSGSGFLDLGFETSGFKIDFVNEFFAPFLAAYKFSREKMHISSPHYGYSNEDINIYFGEKASELKQLIKDAKKSSFVGFIGGPPCPDFSVAGKNKGKNGDNGKLSLSYVNLIVEQNPDYFLFENVKGLWRTARHREFYEELKTKLHDAGYCTTERLCNALEFGVPQDRDRILLIGIRKKLLPKKYYCDSELLFFPWTKYIVYDLKLVKNMPWLRKNSFKENSKSICPKDVEEKLTVEYWFRKNDVYNHQNAEAYFTPKAGIVRMKMVDEGDDSKKCYKRLHRWRYSPTAAYGNNEVHLHPYKVRRISAAEALAIQSMPAEFVLPTNMTLTNMFKTIGNGVPYLLAKGIANSLRDYLEEVLCQK